MTQEELKTQEKELLNLLSENRSKQRELSRIAFVEKHGYDIGDTIECMDGRTTRIGKIDSYTFYGTDIEGFKVTLFKSDGKLGTRQTRILSYLIHTIKLILKA
jgi:hypothetical protein